jgi:hypothetical protein
VKPSETVEGLSGGRVGFNVVTTSETTSAQNFGLDRMPSHADRYAKAAEFLDVVNGLWEGGRRTSHPLLRPSPASCARWASGPAPSSACSAVETLTYAITRSCGSPIGEVEALIVPLVLVRSYASRDGGCYDGGVSIRKLIRACQPTTVLPVIGAPDLGHSSACDGDG